MKWSIKHFKSVVFIVRETWVLAYFPFATLILLLLLFWLGFLDILISLPTNAMIGPGPYTTTLLVPVSDWEKKPLKQCGHQKHCIDVPEYIHFFFDSLVIFRHYFTGNGKVSCIISTISDWFPNKDLKTKVVSWFPLVIGQNTSWQLANSSENLVASAQFWVALVTSESQFRALAWLESCKILSATHLKQWEDTHSHLLCMKCAIDSYMGKEDYLIPNKKGRTWGSHDLV